ncbi:haloalkane dehalogenase [Sphingomonas sp.]|jgi:pimeloyl-ACP methyl ester carboxylesterase|uniref:haloalkane dehalogenase n=1 Tax=Sphingomonas sp. TaxID=28214 RepID=UPI002D805168|nr:haloalkane dehalogenase [Sphingomonas sp.]HEU0045361.1 haloalkane dehalogenase [Sphingomonas sp.]
MIAALRTPEERFAHLSDFDFPVRYLEGVPGYEGLRGAYIDAGPAAAERTFLCLHGEPSWSFLYRKMIPVFLETGARVIAPDLIGFGRSDKPVEEGAYSFDFHRDWLLALVERLELRRVTLVVQDWGGLLGLTLPVDPEFAGRLERLIVMNTALAVGDPPGPGFEAWKAYALATHDLPVGDIIAGGTPHLTAAEKAGYDAPYPDARYKAGARVFPALVPVAPDMPGAAISRQAREWWSNHWNGPSFMAIGDADPVLGPPAMQALRRVIKGCPEPMIVVGGGHFVQEWGEPIARAALEAFEASLDRA